jgi:small subunit ribosomal protein S8
VLRYGRDKSSAIDGIRRVSAPGRRVYVRHDRIPGVRSGMGISILSTSRGVMTDRQAREQRVGGELLCEVW